MHANFGCFHSNCLQHRFMFNIVYNICKESVWSVVRQNNECEYQEDVVQDSGKTGTGVRAEKWALQE